MAHTRDIDSAQPLNTDKSGFGAREFREAVVDITERMELDHQWDVTRDTSLGTGDGYHKKVTMTDLGAVPAAGLVNTGTLYTYDDGSGITELWYEDSAGNTAQLTRGGKIISGVQSSISYFHGVDQIIPGALTQVAFNTMAHEVTAGEFAANTFTAPYTGYYAIKVHLQCIFAHFAGTGFAYLFLNGVSNFQERCTAVGLYAFKLGFNINGYLAAGTTVQVYASSTTPMTIEGLTGTSRRTAIHINYLGN